MKKLLFAILALLTAGFSYAQNTFPLTGNVGISTSNPTAALQIGNFGITSSNQIVIPGTYNFEQVKFGQVSNGNSTLEFVNHTGVVSSYGIRLSVDVDQGAPGLNIQYAPPSQSYETLHYSTGLHLDLNGNISIGTTNHPAGFKFAVAGNAIAESVTVKLKSAWGDYVFNKDYVLKALPELEAYIDQNHHLPEMPSAQQVSSDGLNLGEMSILQTKKIEELTLYLIEKDKQVKEQQSQLANQQKQINDLEVQVKILLSLSNKKG